MGAIPDFLAHLPVHGSLPVPFFTAFVNGKPDFRMHDPRKHNSAIRNRLCGICGKRVKAPYAFHFGPESIGDGISFMPAEHEECARYAMAMCPYLAIQDRQRSERSGGALIVPRETLPPKPDRFALVLVRDYGWIVGPHKSLYAVARDPISTEWWRYEGGALARDCGHDSVVTGAGS